MQQHIDFIIENAAKMSVIVDKEQAEKLLAYSNLIEKWNKTYNLTAIKTLDEILKIHILDSLSIVNYVTPTNLLDVGSGAGLPSIVLAIMLPDLEVCAIDTVGKKVRFMQFVKTSLQLPNFTPLHNRVENLRSQKFKQITSRAFATIDDTIKLSRHLLDESGSFLLMKGAHWQNENSQYTITQTQTQVPFVSDERFLLEITL
jgi:16S rRNA (guanine527-N7)-methyltransferase